MNDRTAIQDYEGEGMMATRVLALAIERRSPRSAMTAARDAARRALLLFAAQGRRPPRGDALELLKAVAAAPSPEDGDMVPEEALRTAKALLVALLRLVPPAKVHVAWQHDGVDRDETVAGSSVWGRFLEATLRPGERPERATRRQAGSGAKAVRAGRHAATRRHAHDVQRFPRMSSLGQMMVISRFPSRVE